MTRLQGTTFLIFPVSSGVAVDLSPHLQRVRTKILLYHTFRVQQILTKYPGESRVLLIIIRTLRTLALCMAPHQRLAFNHLATDSVEIAMFLLTALDGAVEWSLEEDDPGSLQFSKDHRRRELVHKQT